MINYQYPCILFSLGGLRGLSKSIRFAGISTAALAMASMPAQSLDLKTALEITMNTNPEIGEAAANRRAIDFEYQQAKGLSLPALIFRGRAGPERWNNRTTRLIGNNDEFLFGRQASVTLEQTLLNFGRHNAERDAQASRIDGAAIRVQERSLFKALDVVQAYIDIVRLEKVLQLSQQHTSYLQNKVAELERRTSTGVGSKADVQQAQERVSASLVDTSETEEALILAKNAFYEVVGQDIGATTPPSSLLGRLPSSLDTALGIARRNNPTLRISRADLDAARAEHRKAKADKLPNLSFEVTARAGDDLNGFKDNSDEVLAQLVLTYEFRGGIKSAAEQEMLNRTDEVRQRIYRLERNVDTLVKEAWTTRTKTAERFSRLQEQVSQGQSVLSSYEREYEVGRRTVVDMLNAENERFLAEVAMVTAQYSDLYAQYRILASTGTLLDTMGLQVLREGSATMREYEKVPTTPPSEMERRQMPRHYRDIYKGNNPPGGFYIAQGQDTTTQADHKLAKTVGTVTPVSPVSPVFAARTPAKTTSQSSNDYQTYNHQAVARRGAKSQIKTLPQVADFASHNSTQADTSQRPAEPEPVINAAQTVPSIQVPSSAYLVKTVSAKEFEAISQTLENVEANNDKMVIHEGVVYLNVERL